ncbi:MAG: dienelactone hydrolase family protein [Alphaproteobacteria bacterium]|nr:dienelactone hydrolase family protein [Alphaproteobacteria bacterium]
MRLDGPRHPPATGAAPARIVLLLHGYGADGDDLIGLAPAWAPAMPDTLFVSPHAPFPCEGAPFGRQWFGLHGRGDALRLAGLRAASAMVDGFIDDLLAETGLAPSALTLAGFSQGTMLALHAGPRRAEPLAGILGYSGRLLAPELLEREAQSRPPVALVHGERDELVPYASMAEAAAAMEGAGFAVETHGRPGLGHGIDPAGVQAGLAFMARLAGR